MELKSAIEQRRSIRKFKEDPVSEELIAELIEAGRLAPSGSNLQGTRYVIIKSEAQRKKLSDCTPLPFVTKAPVIIACCIDKQVMDTAAQRSSELLEAKAFADTPLEEMSKNTESYKRRDMDEQAIKNYLSVNAAIALDHITLRATDLGLGTCWIMMFDREKTKKALELDDRYEVIALLPVGYPDQDPSQRPRIPAEELVIKTI